MKGLQSKYPKDDRIYVSSILDLRVQVLVARRLLGCPLWKEVKGCPHARHSWLQNRSKAELISETGGTSVELYLRKGKTYCVAVARETSEKKREGNCPEDTQVSEGGVGGAAPSDRAGVPCQPVVQTTVRTVVPCSPWRTMSGQISILQTVDAGAGEPCEKEGGAERNCYGLTTILIPHLPVLLGAGGSRRVKDWDLAGKKKVWGNYEVFLVLSVSHHSISNWQ